mmetsp:Transcript_48735/g.96489  ORF Transcript_48735/g.96489 Transcript_48735/m.96489 type:complete len:214 (-) Transcript_48735:561-1202(-)
MSHLQGRMPFVSARASTPLPSPPPWPRGKSTSLRRDRACLSSPPLFPPAKPSNPPTRGFTPREAPVNNAASALAVVVVVLVSGVVGWCHTASEPYVWPGMCTMRRSTTPSPSSSSRPSLPAASELSNKLSSSHGPAPSSTCSHTALNSGTASWRCTTRVNSGNASFHLSCPTSSPLLVTTKYSTPPNPATFSASFLVNRGTFTMKFPPCRATK